MYAIVNIQGQQFKLSENKSVYVHRLDAKEGDSLTFSEVLLADNNGTITIGASALKGASVKAKVIEHLRGDKVLVFKKKRRKGYQKMNGHRQDLTKIQIESISL